jgi:DNA-directed RNA polymerase subunit L
MKIHCSIIQSAILTKVSGGSAIEYFGNNFVLIGDDAKYIGLLNSELEITETITLWPEAAHDSIAKKEKADLEASCIIDDGNAAPALFVFGSGSKADKRNWVIAITHNNQTYEVQKHENHALFQVLKNTVNDKVNIEAAEYIAPYLVLGNRGNKKHPNNHLICIGGFNTPHMAIKKMVEITLPKQSSEIPFGISGLGKIAGTDYIVVTFSSEDTDNAIDDGAIGPAAIALFSATAIIHNESVAPLSFQLFESFSNEFREQKIESVCVKNNFAYLVADNDNHSSTLFKCHFSIEN